MSLPWTANSRMIAENDWIVSLPGCSAYVQKDDSDQWTWSVVGAVPISHGIEATRDAAMKEAERIFYWAFGIG